jgi:hypothetical protein
VLNQSGVTLTAHGANGSNITNHDWWLDAIGAVRAAGFEPNAHIQVPRSSTSLSKLKEATTNAYLTPPAGLLPMLVTKTVPIAITTGTSTDTSYVFTADWSNLMVGIPTNFSLRFLGERFLADNLQYAFLAYLRADVQLAQPSAFVVDTGVRACCSATETWTATWWPTWSWPRRAPTTSATSASPSPGCATAPRAHPSWRMRTPGRAA